MDRTITFIWPYPANTVVATGTFDNWSCSLPLEKQGDTFTASTQVDETITELQYKFVVDGVWCVDEAKEVTVDGKGNRNNIMRVQVESRQGEDERALPFPNKRAYTGHFLVEESISEPTATTPFIPISVKDPEQGLNPSPDVPLLAHPVSLGDAAKAAELDGIGIRELAESAARDDMDAEVLGREESVEEESVGGGEDGEDEEIVVPKTRETRLSSTGGWSWFCNIL